MPITSRRALVPSLAGLIALGALAPAAIAAPRSETLSATDSFTCVRSNGGVVVDRITTGSATATFTRRGDRMTVRLRTSPITLTGLPVGRFNLRMGTTVYAQATAFAPIGKRGRAMRSRVVRAGSPLIVRPVSFRIAGRSAGLGAQARMNAMAVTTLSGTLPGGGRLDCTGRPAVNDATTWQ